MDNSSQQENQNNLPPVSHALIATEHFRQGMKSGKHWYVALLEAINLWVDDSEEFAGQSYKYLIEGEAFDWLLLAERLCDAVSEPIPEDEKNALLFRGKPPLDLTTEEFKTLIGETKYHRYLNFFYGVTVEEAMVQAVREEVRKEGQANGQTYRREKQEDEIFNRVYGTTEPELRKQFRKSRHINLNTSSSVTEIKEFTYWCFKYRLRECEKAKVASDTQKALLWLRRQGYGF